MALSHEAVLRVLLAVQCCSCGYGIVCPSYGLYGSISIYYKEGLCVCGCMHTYAYNLTWGGLKNGKNGGEPNGFCLIFVMLKKGRVRFGIAPLSFNCFGRFSFNSALLFTVHIRPVLSPCQASNTCCTFNIVMFSNIFTTNNNINTIVHSYDILYYISTVIYIGDHRILLDH